MKIGNTPVRAALGHPHHVGDSRDLPLRETHGTVSGEFHRRP